MATTTPAWSLDDWYSQYAPLSDTQRVSVSRVSAWVSAQVDLAEPVQEEADRTPSPPAMCLTHRLASMATQEARHQHTDDTHQLGLLKESVHELNELTEQVAQVQATMAELRAGLAYVQDSSSELMAKASRLLSEQSALEHQHEEITLRLGYFSVLQPATALLSSSQTHVDTPDFRSTVDRLLLALKFMDSHRQYMDARVYQLRLLNALQRAMSIVRHSFSKAGAELINESLMQIQEMLHVRDYATENTLLDPSSSRVKDLLYDHFEPLHAKFAQYMEDLAMLAAQHDELQRIWQDLRAQWVQWRVSLLHDCLVACIASTGASTMSLCTRLEQVLSSMAQYSEQEQSLSARLFPGSASDAAWLDKVYTAMYERIYAWLAPQCTALDLEALADLAAAVQRYRDEPWCSPLYRDMRERLERSAAVVYKSKLVAFVPSHQDVAYPSVLREWHQASSSHASGTSKEAMSVWYAPVRTVHTLLEGLRPHLPPADLASWTYKAAHMGQQKVQEASNAMRAEKVGSDEGDVGDALLFQLQHLYILRTHVQQMHEMVGDVDTPVPATKSATSSALWFFGSWGASSSQSPSLSTLIQDLEATITATINDVGTFLGASLTLPLKIFLQQTGATREKAEAAWTTFQQSVDANVDDMRAKLPLYVDCQQVEAIVEATLHTLRTTYEAFLARWQAFLAEVSSEEAAARCSELPSPEQLGTQLREKLLTGPS